MIHLRRRSEMVAAAPSSSVIAITGVGGAGCRMVQRHRRSFTSSPEILHLAVNTERACITGMHAMPAILLNADASGVEALKPWLAPCKGLYMLAELGGGCGSTATPALACLAKEAGLHTVALVGLPFEWEGQRRRRNAQHALHAVLESAAETEVVHADAVAEMLGEGATLEEWLEAFSAALLDALNTWLIGVPWEAAP